MSVDVQAGVTLTFERFWRWLKGHPNCIIRAGMAGCYLYDYDAFHWHLEEGADRNPVIQVVWGKGLVAEVVIDIRDVLFVQATPDTESSQAGQYLFEIVGGPQEGPYPIYHFLLAHGFDEEKSHTGPLKQ